MVSLRSPGPLASPCETYGTQQAAKGQEVVRQGLGPLLNPGWANTPAAYLYIEAVTYPDS